MHRPRLVSLRISALLASLALSALALESCRIAPRERTRVSAALVRAQEFLAQELAQWHAEERCASCHHDGDAARVLWSIDAGFDALREARLAEHRDRLLRSSLWCDPQGDPRFRDERLALVQRAAALQAALARGARIDVGAVETLLDALRRQQEEPGCWLGSTTSGLGGPVTYGPFLATALAISVLQDRADGASAEAVRRGRAWFASASPSATLEHAAVAWALAAPRDAHERAARDRSVAALLARAQRSGGFAPWEEGPSEVFDTALTLLALEAQPASPGITRACAAARGYLEREQELDGGWRETTRPAGGESRAHRVSTSAWAAQALAASHHPMPRSSLER